jgi:hypothetical protein
LSLNISRDRYQGNTYRPTHLDRDKATAGNLARDRASADREAGSDFVDREQLGGIHDPSLPPALA